MRTKEFEFKKTKSVKTVTKHRAISVDLTEQEAADLGEVLYSGVGGTAKAREFLLELMGELRRFSLNTTPSVRRRVGPYAFYEDA